MATASCRATVASIRSIYGQRLTKTDYRELTGMHNVSEVAAYLKETPAYADVLADIEPSLVHRGHFESVLARSIFEHDMHICKLERLQNTPFFRFFIMDYEVQELLKAIQLLPDDNADYISVMASWLAPYACFPLDDLARAKTPQDIVDAIAHTPYQAALKAFYTNNDHPSDFIACEIALRSCYLEHLRSDAKNVCKGSDLQALNDLIGEQVDLINLINAYRLKSVFHTDEDTLAHMMLPVAGKLPKRVLQQLYDAPDADAFRRVLRTTRYGRLLGTGTLNFDHVQMEHAFQMLRFQTARNALHFSGHAAVSLYAIHYLFQVEVQNLITIIESIRYGKAAQYILPHLILES